MTKLQPNLKESFCAWVWERIALPLVGPGIYEEIEKPRFPMIINYCLRVYDFTGLTLQYYVVV